jgi:hypothetical protein
MLRAIHAVAHALTTASAIGLFLRIDAMTKQITRGRCYEEFFSFLVSFFVPFCAYVSVRQMQILHQRVTGDAS